MVRAGRFTRVSVPLLAAALVTLSAPAAHARLRVEVARGSIPGLPTPLYVPLEARVFDAAGEAVQTDELAVFAQAVDAAGAQSEVHELRAVAAREPNVTPNLFTGIVIVPRPGRWTFEVFVSRRQPGVVISRTVPPETLGVGQLVLVVDGRALLGTGLAGDDIPQDELGAGDRSVVLPMLLRWLHAGAAVLWVLAVLLLALIGVPSARRLVSRAGLVLLDGRVGRIIGAMFWATTALVITGLYNLATQVAYAVPLSAERWQALSALPYANAYFRWLGAKLLMFALLVVAAAVLARAARKRSVSALLSGDEAIGEPWSLREGREGFAVVVVVVGLTFIMLAVTVTTSLHRLVEAGR